MIYVLLGKPLVFWIGLVALISFAFQLYTGIKMSRGNFEFLPGHRFNAALLSVIIIIHLLFGLSLYL